MDLNRIPYFIANHAISGDTYNYNLYSFNNTTLTRNIDFNQNNEDISEIEENEDILEIEEIQDIEDDKLLVENIIDISESIENIYFKKEEVNINGKEYTIYLYKENSYLQLRVFNDNDFLLKQLI